MVSKRTHKNITWINLESPTSIEFNEITEDFHIPVNIAAEIQRVSQRSKSEYFKEGVYLNLHLPNIDRTGRVINCEFDFILKKDLFISITRKPSPRITEFNTFFEDKIMNNKVEMSDEAISVLYYFLRFEYGYILEHVDDMTRDLETIEDKVYKSIKKETIEELTKISHNIADFRRVLYFHQDSLDSLFTHASHLWGDKFHVKQKKLSVDLDHIRVSLSRNYDFLHELRDSADSILNIKTGDTIKKLTIVNFLVLPLALVAAIFGMNTTPDILLLTSHEKFFGLIGVMMVFSLLIFIYIKSRKWL